MKAPERGWVYMKLKKLVAALCSAAVAMSALTFTSSAGELTSKSLDDCDYSTKVGKPIDSDNGYVYKWSGVKGDTKVDKVLVDFSLADSVAATTVAIGFYWEGYNEYSWYSDSVEGVKGPRFTAEFDIPDEAEDFLVSAGYPELQIQYWWGSETITGATVEGIGLKFKQSKVGDVDGSGAVDIVDMAVMSKYFVGATVEKFDEKAADINQDGALNIIDGILLKASFLGLYTLPTSGSDGPSGPDNPEEMRDVDGLEFVKEMKLGWNLGNTLDATNDRATNLSPSQFETSWGNPLTTKAMIDKIKASGFNTVRVPVSWGQKMGSAPDYTINPAWLDRVQEVVNYVIDNDMYCILNSHHDTAWLYPSAEKEAAATAQLKKLWEQVGKRFANYDEHLVFETMNEPRLVGTNLEWSGGDSASRAIINRFNQAALDTIRATGGNNASRYVMVPTYAASGSSATVRDFVVPNDKHIIVSIHSYSPYSFALDKTGTKNWAGTASDKSALDSEFDYLVENFVSKNIPVVIGEFGAMNKENLEDRVRWAEYYIKSAKTRGITCVWWDNNAFSGRGENFGLFNRGTLQLQYPEIMEALL